MAIDFYRLNGTNPSFNYEQFEETARKELGKTCSNAKLYLLNNFPVSINGISNIDILLVISVENRHRNYFRIVNSEGNNNIQNLIIALQIREEYSNQDLYRKDGKVEMEDSDFPDFTEENLAIKWGLTNYLCEHCGMERKYISVLPVTYVRNKLHHCADNLVISPQFDFRSLKEILEGSEKKIFNGYFHWYRENSHEDLTEIVKKILERASFDSREGYLTKAKIERIQKKMTGPQHSAFEQIGRQLVQVKGKAGTGKSSDLLKWMLNLNMVGTSTAFFTYNHLLVYDISKQVKSFQTRKINQGLKIGSASVQTLHSFFFRLSKKLGVLHLMSEKRSNEILAVLDTNLKILKRYFNDKIQEYNGEISLQRLKYLIQNDKVLKEGTKREGIEFINGLLKTRSHIKIGSDLEDGFNNFRTLKKESLKQLQAQKIFLPDYYNVLEQTLELIHNRDSFFDEYDIGKKYELLSPVMPLDDKILEEDTATPTISREKYKTRINRSLGGIKKGRIIFIDEAQDCHERERDILFAIFKPENIVIANGGKEQLIRHTTLCNWGISRANIIRNYDYSKRSKSFRMKPAIAHLSNFIARAYDIDLNIEPLDSEDHGKVIIRIGPLPEPETISKLTHYSTIQGCTPYEGVLILNNSSTNRKNYTGRKTDISIGEYGNIILRENIIREKSQKVENIDENVSIWDGIVTNKKDLGVPVSSSIRSILYESCRGLEAWCSLCISLDLFFEAKRNEPEAENYLLTDLFDQLNNEKRKDLYAATWALMALTRAIDTCYIHLENQFSSFSRILLKFAVEFPEYVELQKE